jgi:hypothetical protein
MSIPDKFSIPDFKLSSKLVMLSLIERIDLPYPLLLIMCLLLVCDFKLNDYCSIFVRHVLNLVLGIQFHKK